MMLILIVAFMGGFMLAWPVMFLIASVFRQKGPTVTELTDACKVLIWEFHRTPRAENFCGWSGRLPDGREFEITVQRIGGKTPSMRIVELEAEVKQLRDTAS